MGNFTIHSSLYTKAQKCELQIWNEIHKPDLVKIIKKNNTAHNYSLQNYEIRNKARLLFDNVEDLPKGEIPKWEGEQKVYFNVFVQFQDLENHIGILKINSENSVEITEIKPIANPKLENFHELAFSAYILEKLGFSVDSMNILLINPKYKFIQTFEPELYFAKTDVTKKVKNILPGIEEKLQRIREILNLEQMPVRKNHKACGKPGECKMKDLCWEDLGDANIFFLREGGELVKNLYLSGVKYIKDIPEETELLDSQRIQIQSEKFDKPHIDKKKIQEFLEKIKYPICFLDFETINPALPIYEKSRPFQHIPFLFYMFRKNSPESELEEFYYFEENGDSRKEIVQRLSEIIPKEGSIICYNDMIEKKCIQESCELVPELSEWKEAIWENFIDLSVPFRNFYYYHKDQNGAASLKALLSPLTGLNYKNLTIQDGNTANLEFLRSKLHPDRIGKREELRKNLIEYCRLDSFAMVKILESLVKLQEEEDF